MRSSGANGKLAAAIACGALTLAVLSALLLIAAHPAEAQTETVLYNLCSVANCADGGLPVSRLTSDAKGNLFGTALYGGIGYPQNNGYGTVFELSPNGSGGWNETTLYAFTGGADGGSPYSNVIFDSAGNLYGTTIVGGDLPCNPPPDDGCGVVFKLSPAATGWTETVLYRFSGGADGEYPTTGLIMDSADNIYGTTLYGGSNGPRGCVFELSPSGGGWTEKVIYSLGSLNFDSEGDAEGLTLGADGNIFLTEQSVVAELSPNGDGGWNPSLIHTFTSENFANYVYSGGPVTLDLAGNLYGTRTRGGTEGFGVVYELSPGKNGKWKKADLYSFGRGIDAFPWGGVVFDAAGNIYGATIGEGGLSTPHGNFGEGTVFELVPQAGPGSYQEKVLWTFSDNNYVDGVLPLSGVILDGAGSLYGTTFEGGTGGGVVFEVTP